MLNPVTVQIGPRDSSHSNTMTDAASVAPWALGRRFGLCQPQPHAKEAVHAAVL